mmetsp:Transcript_77201/g.146909  ORF Transcript_77201/g.146909 Transcript_77201/m.146909 type:complete len:304 (+) Transcript_77201:106-1017(+)
MMAKLMMVFSCFTAAHMSLANDACTTDFQEETSMGGHAMLQVSESAPHGRKSPSHVPSHKSEVHSHAPSHESKVKTNSTQLTAKSKAKAKTPDASNVALSQSGYKTIADMCCNYEMEEYIRRVVLSEDLKICSEGGLEGMVPYHTCENKQNYSILQKEIAASSSGACPWTAPADEACKKISKACGSQTADPMTHRRRNCGRNDNSQDLDLEMQNAATQEFTESKCGTHQKYTDVESTAGVLKSCKIKGDITDNSTAIKTCLDECCDTSSCIGITVSEGGTTLQQSFEDSEASEGSIAYLHRQR